MPLIMDLMMTVIIPVNILTQMKASSNAMPATLFVPLKICSSLIYIESWNFGVKVVRFKA